MNIRPFTLLIIICLASLVNLSLANKSFDPAKFKVAEKILIADVKLKIQPLREYKIKAGTSGLLNFYVPYKSNFHEQGTRLGGINTERIELDRKLIGLSEALMKEKEIPEWHLQRRTKLEQLQNQLTQIKAEQSLTKQMLADPVKFGPILEDFGEEKDQRTEKLQSYLENLLLSENELSKILSYTSSERKADLEIGQLTKKFELRKLQFDQRILESYLTVPFSGQVDFLFPYVDGEDNYIQSGMEVAVVRDLRELFGNVPIMDPNWRLWDTKLLELEMKTRNGTVTAKYHKSFTQNISNQDELIYSFKFLKENIPLLSTQLGGTTEGKLFCNLGKPAHLIPKFLLVSLDSELFREDGWQGLIKKFCPEYELSEIGLYSIALAKAKNEIIDNNSSN